MIPMHFGQPTTVPARGSRRGTACAVIESARLLGVGRSKRAYRAALSGHLFRSSMPEQILLTSGASAGLVVIFT